MKINLLEKGASNEAKSKYGEINDLTLVEWLKNINLLGKSDYLIEYDDIASWQRGGTETYNSIFKIAKECNGSITYNKVIVKAIVTGISEQSTKTWIKRREILHEARINVVKWYTVSNFLIYEDFLPYDYKYCKDINLIKKFALTLDELGFNTFNFLDDIRCNENGEPFYVDFGQDLGNPNEKPSTSSYQTFLKKFNK